MDPGSVWAVVGWIVLHVAAFSTACIARIAEGSCLEALAQASFFAAMAAIGTTTWICQQLDVGWTWSAITLMAMVLTAVIDFRRVSDAAPAGVGQ